MIEKTVTVKTALDARQSAELVQTASKFDSEVQIRIDEKLINAKSIMGTIAINMQDGETATIIATGADEELAVEEVANFIS